MRGPKTKYPTGLVAAFLLVASACSILPPQTDHSRYFVLEPLSGSDTPANGSSHSQNLTVGLGPITIPLYLDRPEVLTRLSETEFSVSDTDRWAEPLDASVSRVLAQDLSSDLPSVQIVPYPWSHKTQIDYRVSVDFRRLERTADGKAEVQAVWTINKGVSNKLMRRGITTSSALAGDDQRSASAALSQGISQVSREIAQALEQQSQA